MTRMVPSSRRAPSSPKIGTHDRIAVAGHQAAVGGRGSRPRRWCWIADPAGLQSGKSHAWCWLETVTGPAIAKVSGQSAPMV